MTIEENVRLAPYTTFRIGGPARFFIRVTNTEDLREAMFWVKERALPVLVLGGGSNVLLPDEGFSGAVIRIEIEGIVRTGNTLEAGAGESWDTLVARAVEEGLWGLENLSGIPGTVGGAVAGNIGAYGQALSGTLAWVDAMDKNGELRRFANKECLFGYRESVFTGGGCVLLRAGFDLSPEPRPDLSYRDLAAHFGAQTPTIADVREAVLDIRQGKFPDLSREGSAGSFFKNPILPKGQAFELEGRYPGIPLFDMPEVEGVKVPLAWILDRVLHLKGAHSGGARLFEKQPLVIAARFGTSAKDVVALAKEVKKKLKDECALVIEEEVKIIS